jgi:hypothetical protein
MIAGERADVRAMRRARCDMRDATCAMRRARCAVVRGRMHAKVVYTSNAFTLADPLTV